MESVTRVQILLCYLVIAKERSDFMHFSGLLLSRKGTDLAGVSIQYTDSIIPLFTLFTHN